MKKSELTTGDVFVSNRRPPEDLGVVIDSGSKASDDPGLFVAGWFEEDGGIRIEHSVLVNEVSSVTGQMDVPEIILRMRQFHSPSSMSLWIPILQKKIEGN